MLPVSGISVQRSTTSLFGNSTSQTTISFGPAVVNPAAFGGALSVSQASWMVLPQAPALARGDLEALDVRTKAAIAQLSVLLPKGLNVTSSLPQRLNGIASTIVLTRSLFTIAALLLLVVAGAGLLLAARLLAGLREEESALLRARGATRSQVVRPVLAEATLLGAAAGLAGMLVGTYLTSVLGRLAGLRLGGYTGHGIIPLAWLSALAMLVLCVVVMAWPALHAPTPDAARLRRAGRPGSRASPGQAAIWPWWRWPRSRYGNCAAIRRSRIRPRDRSGSIRWWPSPPPSRWPGWHSSRSAGCRCWPGWPTGRPTTGVGWLPPW